VLEQLLRRDPGMPREIVALAGGIAVGKFEARRECDCPRCVPSIGAAAIRRVSRVAKPPPEAVSFFG